VGAPQADLGVTALGAFEALRHGDAVAYGVKAANLGELRRLLPAEHRVDGFAIPFAAYDRFVREGALAGQIAALLDDPAARADTVARNARLKALRAAITAAPFEPALLAAVKTAAVTHYGAGATTLPLRFRSSTNAEDLDDLSGAGLYESKSGCLADDEDGDDEGPSRCLTAARKTQLESYLARWQAELAAHPDRHWIGEIVEGVKSDLTKEKPVATAIRKVWASLWNDRAFDDREYYAIDHRRVFMGIAVHPAFHGEQAEAVAVTNLPGGSGAPVFRVVAQLGEVGVVRPIDPSAVPETLTFQRSPAHAPTAVMRLTPSSISPGGAPMWSDAALRVLAGLLFQVQDHFVGVYGGNRARRFDVEVDVTSDARIVVKQVRPNP
jgi:hypothetical protein